MAKCGDGPRVRANPGAFSALGAKAALGAKGRGHGMRRRRRGLAGKHRGENGFLPPARSAIRAYRNPGAPDKTFAIRADKGVVEAALDLSPRTRSDGTLSRRILSHRPARRGLANVGRQGREVAAPRRSNPAPLRHAMTAGLLRRLRGGLLQRPFVTAAFVAALGGAPWRRPLRWKGARRWKRPES
jgi:hypothetical protein